MYDSIRDYKSIIYHLHSQVFVFICDKNTLWPVSEKSDGRVICLPNEKHEPQICIRKPKITPHTTNVTVSMYNTNVIQICIHNY